MVSLLYVFIWWDLVPTSPWGKLHPVPTAMLIVTMISIRTHSVRHLVSIGNRFPWLYCINCFQSPWFQCIIIEYGIFLWWMSKRGEGVHVSKERGGDIKKGENEKRNGDWYTLPHYGTNHEHVNKTCWISNIKGTTVRTSRLKDPVTIKLTPKKTYINLVKKIFKLYPFFTVLIQYGVAYERCLIPVFLYKY